MTSQRHKTYLWRPEYATQRADLYILLELFSMDEPKLSCKFQAKDLWEFAKCQYIGGIPSESWYRRELRRISESEPAQLQIVRPSDGFNLFFCFRP